MRIAPAAVLALSCSALALAPSADAGPPRGICRHLSPTACEDRLGPYSAFRFLLSEVIPPLETGVGGSLGYGGGCGPTAHRTPRFYRCELTVQRSSLPSPCIAEALLYMHRHDEFEVKWRSESDSCKS